MDRRAWWATVHGVAKSWTQLNNQAHTKIITHKDNYIYSMNMHYSYKEKNLPTQRPPAPGLIITDF